MGTVRLEYANASIARLLSFCLKTGMTTQAALHLVIQATPNKYVSWKLGKTYEDLLEQGSFTKGVENNHTLIPSLKSALAVGEASGCLAMILACIA
jgi:type II secretory pathway component PulF